MGKHLSVIYGKITTRKRRKQERYEEHYDSCYQDTNNSKKNLSDKVDLLNLKNLYNMRSKNCP